MIFVLFFFLCYGDHHGLHVLTPSFPTRRSSDLRRHRLVSAASRWRGAARLPDPARDDRAWVLAFLCDRAQHRLAAAADRIAAQGGEGVMGALKGILDRKSTRLNSSH